MDRYFFKILIKDFPSHLKFPPVFVKNFGKQIPNTTKLEVKGYHEKSWEVEVEKNGKIQYFSKGWRKFVEENNLEEFDFLVFKYLVDSKSFKVTIYGKITCCVKEFPISKKRVMKGARRNKSKIDGDNAYERDVILIDSDDEDIDTLKQTEYNGRTKEHCIEDGGKRQRVEEDDDDYSNRKMKGARMTRSKIKGVKAYESDGIRTDSDHEDKNTLKQPVCKGKTKSGRKCKCGEGQMKFNSKNPFFEAELHESHFLNNGYVHIRRCFFMEHLSMKKVKVVKLYISKDIRKLGIYVIQKRREARISSGWAKFVKDYGLEMGDFCVFEMIESNNINVSFHVHVYRKAGDKKEFVKMF